jgi:hypothetical protein
MVHRSTPSQQASRPQSSKNPLPWAHTCEIAASWLARPSPKPPPKSASCAKSTTAGNATKPCRPSAYGNRSSAFSTTTRCRRTPAERLISSSWSDVFMDSVNTRSGESWASSRKRCVCGNTVWRNPIRRGLDACMRWLEKSRPQLNPHGAPLPCPDRGHQLLLAFTCKAHHLCPACHQRRTPSVRPLDRPPYVPPRPPSPVRYHHSQSNRSRGSALPENPLVPPSRRIHTTGPPDPDHPATRESHRPLLAPALARPHPSRLIRRPNALAAAAPSAES